MCCGPSKSCDGCQPVTTITGSVVYAQIGSNPLWRCKESKTMDFCGELPGYVCRPILPANTYSDSICTKSLGTGVLLNEVARNSCTGVPNVTICP